MISGLLLYYYHRLKLCCLLIFCFIINDHFLMAWPSSDWTTEIDHIRRFQLEKYFSNVTTSDVGLTPTIQNVC